MLDNSVWSLMVIKIQLNEFLAETFFNEGVSSPTELRSAGLGHVLDDNAKIDEKTAEKLSQTLNHGSVQFWLNLNRHLEG